MDSKLHKLCTFYGNLYGKVNEIFIQKFEYKKNLYKIEYGPFLNLQNDISELAAILNMQFDEDKNYLRRLYSEYQNIINTNFIPSSNNNFSNHYNKTLFQTKITEISNLFSESKIYAKCPNTYQNFLKNFYNNFNNLIAAAEDLKSLLNEDSMLAINMIKTMDDSQVKINYMSVRMNAFLIEMKNHYDSYTKYCNERIKPRVDRGEINYTVLTIGEWWHKYLIYGDELAGAGDI